MSRCIFDPPRSRSSPPRQSKRESTERSVWKAEIAVMAASHSGQPLHVQAVLSILRKIGMDASALQCGAHLPYDENAANALRGAGDAAERASQQLLRKARRDSRALQSLTRRSRNVSEREQSRPEARSSSFARASPTKMLRLGRSPSTVAAYPSMQQVCARPHSHLRVSHRYAASAAQMLRHSVSCAMQWSTYPQYVAGTGQLDTELIAAGNRKIVAKAGAEGVHGVAAIEPGVGYVSKVLDGNSRGRGPSTLSVLSSWEYSTSTKSLDSPDSRGR